MSTEQVPREQWEDYLAGFSAKNQTRPITVDIEDPDLGPQRIVEHIPLLGVEWDFKDRENNIIVVAGDPQGEDPESIAHEINQPKTIWVKADDTGRVEALDIESEGGRTIIEFD